MMIMNRFARTGLLTDSFGTDMKGRSPYYYRLGLFLFIFGECFQTFLMYPTIG